MQDCELNQDGECVWKTNAENESKYSECMEACAEEEIVDLKGCRCAMDYNPICCDGEQYTNPCNAECKGGIAYPAEEQTRCKMGECRREL